MPVTIKTNNQWRNLVYRTDVPRHIRETEFDYHDAEETFDGFFHYRGSWYHLDQFTAVENNADLAGWHGYASDSYFSGVLIKLSADGEQVICATYFS